MVESIEIIAIFVIKNKAVKISIPGMKKSSKKAKIKGQKNETVKEEMIKVNRKILFLPAYIFV